MEQVQNGPVERRYAGFWIRFWASLLDGVVLSALFIIIRYLLGVSLTEPPLGIQLLEWLVSIVYSVALTVRFGQTLGKMALGIRVIRQDGSPNTWGPILLRETIGKFVSFIILLIGYIMAAFDSKKRALHDRIAGTYVVRIQN